MYLDFHFDLKDLSKSSCLKMAELHASATPKLSAPSTDLTDLRSLVLEKSIIFPIFVLSASRIIYPTSKD